MVIVMKDKRNVCKLLFCIFILILLVHFFFSFSNDDVTYFSTILDTMNLKDFLIFRYSTWTSRILIEGLLVFISRNIYLWRVLDSCVMILFIWCVQRLCFREIHVKSIIFTLLILLLLPFVDMTEAGFCATTMNYFWPLTFMLLSFLPIRDLYVDKKINKKIVFFYILASLYACNQEQCVCVVFAVSLISIVYFWKSKQKHWYPCFLLLISLLSLVFILSCPGNAIRSAHEIESWYLDYKNA